MFSTAFAATLYAVWPLLWRDPLNLTDAFGALAQYPVHVATLFRGDAVQWPNMPWDYVPAWILITTPPAALALAAIGTVYAARLCAADWRGAFENSTARFGLLALACLILPVAAAVALNSNLYDDWRHMYFLYAPTCVLAAFGLRALADVPRPNLRAVALAPAALGIALAGVQTVRLHPYQNEYFSPIVDKSALAVRWEMGYWLVSRREALEKMLETQPAGRVSAADPDSILSLHLNVRTIPKDDRGRIEVNPNFPSFITVSGSRMSRSGGGYDGRPVVWTREIYGVPLVSDLDARADSEAAFRAAYAAARAVDPGRERRRLRHLRGRRRARLRQRRLRRRRRARNIRPVRIPRRTRLQSGESGAERRLETRVARLRLPQLRRVARRQMRYRPRAARLPDKPHRNRSVAARRRRAVERGRGGWRLADSRRRRQSATLFSSCRIRRRKWKPCETP